jgi:hypothetical protein
MRSLRRFMVLVPAIAVYLIAAEGVYADTFQFSYSGNTFVSELAPGIPPIPIAPISGSGTFTAIPQSGGSFLITSISGTQNGIPMSLSPPAPPFGNDGLLFASAPFLDAFGFSFTTGSTFNNIEFNSTDPNEPFSYILTGAVNNCGVVPISFSISAVPEPSTLILFGSGIFALAAAWRRRRLNAT